MLKPSQAKTRSRHEIPPATSRFDWLFGCGCPERSCARALAQADVAYERFDVNITVLADGRFTVQEIQQIRFFGEYTTGFAEIPLAYTTSIENITVTGGPSLARQTPYQQRSGAGRLHNFPRGPNAVCGLGICPHQPWAIRWCLCWNTP
jgi:hypothetical protein